MFAYQLIVLSFLQSIVLSARICGPPFCYNLDPAYRAKAYVSSDRNYNWTVFCYQGQKESLLLFWSNVLVKISFHENSTPSYFHVVNGHDLDEIEHRKNNFNSFLKFVQKLYLLIKKEGEGLPLQPFNASCIGVHTDAPYTATLNLKYIELWFVAYLLAGIVLFFSAKSWSQNTSLHYGTGVSIGIMASVLILVIILYRLFPKSLKTTGYVFLAVGCSTSLWLITGFINRLYDPLANTISEYWRWILGYFITTGLLSFGICYKYGPITDPKMLNLVQWSLQCVGLVLVYNGTQIKELSFAIILILLTIYNFPKGLLSNRFTRYFRYKLFPPKPRLLTEEEYHLQGLEETRKALEDLRNYCRSPDCNAWKTLSRLKSPNRFAQFIEGDSMHITDEEILQYDSGPEPTPPIDADDIADESDIEFELTSP